MEVTITDGKKFCYYVSTSKVTPWQQIPGGTTLVNVAVAGCASIGLKLANIASDQEKSALINLMSKFLLLWLWVMTHVQKVVG